MNDPPTLELYSRVLLFSSDPLRDELSFSRSLSPAQRKTVHLIARKLELEHRSLGEGERRCVVVYKKGCAPPVVAKESEGGGAKTQPENGRIGNGTGGDRFARMDPPRRVSLAVYLLCSVTQLTQETPVPAASLCAGPSRASSCVMSPRAMRSSPRPRPITSPRRLTTFPRRLAPWLP